MLDDTKNVPATLRRLSEIVDEYDEKAAAIPAEIEEFRRAETALETAATIGGRFAGSIWRRGSPHFYESDLRANLLESAWRHVMDGLQIKRIATAKDRDRLEQSMSNPPAFTLDNIRATFGTYLQDTRSHILRGVAEAFCDLDPAYKSHSKVKIGVSALPKRIIISNALAEYGGGWREGQLRDVLNALNVLAGRPHLDEYQRAPKEGQPEPEIGFNELCKLARKGNEPTYYGVTLKGFRNGNVHLHFDKTTLRAINLALAEFYGEVLPDTPDEDAKRQPGTAVSKDLQYYPTPAPVIRRIVKGRCWKDGDLILEPSCGDGRILTALRAENPNLRLTGIEVDAGRAEQARAAGHHVICRNFLELAPNPIFDGVVMNPPFYGRHYLKHLRNALNMLKPGGFLYCILPATAHYDHGELPDGQWEDLPVGSFSESGTNIPTGILHTSRPG